MNEINELVQDVVRSKLKGRQKEVDVQPDTKLKDIGLSSLQIADIVYSLEEKFSVEFDSVNAANIATVSDVATMVDTAIAARK